MSDALDNKEAGVRLFRTPAGWCVRIYEPATGRQIEAQAFKTRPSALRYFNAAISAARDTARSSFGPVRWTRNNAR